MPIHLSEEQTQIGKENFYEVLGSDAVKSPRAGVTRREFLVSSLATAGAVGAGYFAYGKMTKERIKVAWIGTGDEGSVLITQFPKDYMEIVAIADLRPSNRARAKAGDGNTARVGLNARLGSAEAAKIQEYDDHKKMLEAEKDNIQAVVIAVPLSEHARVAIDCLDAGLHVLSEKLMAHNVTECKKMIRKAKEKNLLLAVGHQRHYSVLYDNAHAIIDDGLLGTIKHIRASWHRNNSFPGKDSWNKPIPPKDAELDEARLKKFGYDNVDQLVRWRLYNKTGGGLMAELGSHQLDACSIFLGKVRPIAVQGYGGKNFYGIKNVGPEDKWADTREIDDHVYTIFEFPGKHYAESKDDKVVVTYSSLNTNRQEPYGETVFGSRGTLMMVREQQALLFKEGSGSNRGGFDQRVTVNKGADNQAAMAASESVDERSQKAASTGSVSRGYTEEMEHFAYCIAEGIYTPPDKRPAEKEHLRCNGYVAMQDAIMALTSNLAMKHQKRIAFKDEWFDPASDAVPETDEQITG